MTNLSEEPNYLAVSVDNAGYVHCPACGEKHGMEGGDTVYDAGLDCDEYDSPAGTRGGWIATQGHCGHCGQRFSFVIGNHKGMLCLQIAALGQL